MSHQIARVAYSTLALILASQAAIASATAFDTEAPRRTVRYADLDIEHAAGAAALYERIRVAAREVCAPESSTWQLTFRRETGHCREEAIERAVKDVNAPALTNYHLMKSQPSGDRR